MGEATPNEHDRDDVPVWVIEEPGATWVFYTEQDARRGFSSELEAMNGQAVLYSGTIPARFATRDAQGIPDDAAVEYVMREVSPDEAASKIIESWG